MPGNWHVLFGKGPTEKDSSQEYLAGGLLHSGRGRRKRTPARSTSPAAYFTREGADGKGLQPGVPRRRPTSLGEGRLETGSGLGSAEPATLCMDSAGPFDHRASLLLYHRFRRWVLGVG